MLWSSQSLSRTRNWPRNWPPTPSEIVQYFLKRPEVFAMLLTTAVPAMPDTWIKLLTLYGVPALFIFMVLILLDRARRNRGLTGQQQRVQTIAFSFVWILIFLLAIMIAANWWLEKHPQEFQIEGVITNLRDPEFITTRQELFLRNHPIAGKDFQYDWRLITPQRFTGQLELLLQAEPKATIVFNRIVYSSIRFLCRRTSTKTPSKLIIIARPV